MTRQTVSSDERVRDALNAQDAGALKDLIVGGADHRCTSATGRTPLMLAAKAGDAELCGLLLARGADIAAADDRGDTALHTALLGRSKKAGVLRLLIDSGASMSSRNVGGETSLFMAVDRGHEAVRIFLRHGADVEAKNAGGETPLARAALNGRLDMVEVLAEYGASINTLNRHWNSPLFWAVCGGHYDIAKFLLDRGARHSTRNRDGVTPLMRAASQVCKPAHPAIVRLLIERGADVNEADASGVTPLMQAAMGGNDKIAGMLLASGARVDARSSHKETALVMACRAGKNSSLAVVKALVDGGAKLTVKSRDNIPLLYLAVQSGSAGIVRALLDAGRDANENSGAVVRLAAGQGRADILQVLIDMGADVNLADSDGITALMLAAAGRKSETAKVLIEAGADVNAVTRPGSWGGDRTVLMFALGIEDGMRYVRCAPPAIDPGLIELLLRKGADPRYDSTSGITALELARRKRDRRLTRLFNGGCHHAER